MTYPQMMLNIRTRKVLRDLVVNKARITLIVVAIAVGVFALSTVLRAREILDRDPTQSYLSVNPAHAKLRVEWFDNDYVDSVKRLDNVQDVAGRQVVWARIRLVQGDWHTLKLIAIPDFTDIPVNKMAPQAGQWPPTNRTIVIERTSLVPLKANIGDEIIVEAPNGQQRQIPLIGTVHDLNSFPSDRADFVLFGYITFDTLDWFGLPRSYNEMLITVAEENKGLVHIHQVIDNVESHLEKAGRRVFGTSIGIPGQHQFHTILQSILTVLNILGWFALVMSGLLVVNTISAILTQHIQQIGVMKTIGASLPDILGMYFSMVLVFSLLAILISLPLGIITARVFSIFLAGVMNFDIHSFSVTLQVPFLEISAGLLVPFLVALYPIITGARITVREAISLNQINQFGQSGFDRLLGKLPRVSATGLYALRNMFRRKDRLILTLVVLSIGGGIFIAVLSVNRSIQTTIDTDISAYWQQDISINFRHPYRTKEIVNEALQVSGVTYAEGWNIAEGFRTNMDENLIQEAISVFAVPPNSPFIQPTVLAGRWLTDNDGNALVVNVDFVAKNPDIKVGDTLELEVEGRQQIWQVVGTVTTQLVGFGEPKLELPIVYVPKTVFAEINRQRERANRLVVETQRPDFTFQDQISAALDAHFNNRGFDVLGLETRGLILNLTNFIIGVITVMLFLMAALFAIVGGISLMSTMSLNVLERTREIGVLRAIGADTPSVRQIILYEGVLIGLLSWGLAVLLIA
ncbi:MAG: FtsX-like permease family protein [Chloroflexota bacterium]